MEADRDELRITLEIKRGEAERAEDDAARCRREKVMVVVRREDHRCPRGLSGECPSHWVMSLGYFGITSKM